MMRDREFVGLHRVWQPPLNWVGLLNQTNVATAVAVHLPVPPHLNSLVAEA